MFNNTSPQQQTSFSNTIMHNQSSTQSSSSSLDTKDQHLINALNNDTNNELIKQLLHSNPQLHMYLHQLSSANQAQTSLATPPSSNIGFYASTMRTENMFSQQNQESLRECNLPYVMSGLDLQEHNIHSTSPTAQHDVLLSLHLSSEELHQLLLLEQHQLEESQNSLFTTNTPPNNYNSLNLHSLVKQPSTNACGIPIVNMPPSGIHLFPQQTCAPTSGENITQCVITSTQKQNSASLVRKHLSPTSDLRQQSQPINLLYSASTSNNSQHIIQPNTQFMDTSPSLSLHLNEMEFYDYMNQPLTDLPPQQYHSYLFDGCEFILPIRYSPIMRGSHVVFLGRGAYGHVIAANDTQTGTIVAIKKVQNVFDKAAYRMLREVKIMRHLRGHPNIVTLIDIFIPGNNLNEFKDLYIVSECMNGGDLGRIMANLCNEKQCLSIDNIRDIMGQLLSAMYYLQSAGVLHRDMKPSNILLSQKFQVKLSDFGMSRNEASNQQVTNPQSLAVVTEIYRPPEVVLNYEIQTSAIDSWSVGCIFAELLYMLPPSPKRRPLFVILKDSEIRAPNHYEHLNLMASLLGKPKTNELKGNPQFVQELLQLLENFPSQGYDFSLIFPSAPPEAIDLMKRFLTWSPETRISFEDALNHPFIRSSSMINRIRAGEKIGSLDEDINVSSEKIKLLFYKEIVSWKYLNK